MRSFGDGMPVVRRRPSILADTLRDFATPKVGCSVSPNLPYCVVLRDFSLEEPALGEVDGISRVCPASSILSGRL